MSEELDPMWAHVSAIMGEHTCKKIIEGVCEHTFTPQPSGSLEAAKIYMQPAIDQMEQRRKKWLDEYMKWSKESLLRELEEMSKPTYDTPYMRYLAWQPQIVMPSLRLLPYRAEGTRPPSALLSLHRSIVRCQRVERRIMAAHQAHKRERRQHRAAFRRRKRGLA